MRGRPARGRIGLAGCSPVPRSAAYFEAHREEAAKVVAGCETGAHRGEECVDAQAGVAAAERQARMAAYRRASEAPAVAEPFQIFQPAYQFVDEKLNVFLGERASSVIAEVSGPLRAALVLYVLLYGFAILRGSIAEPVMDFAVRSVKLAFVYMLATTVAYSTYVTDPLFHVLPDTLAPGDQRRRRAGRWLRPSISSSPARPTWPRRSPVRPALSTSARGYWPPWSTWSAPWRRPWASAW